MFISKEIVQHKDLSDGFDQNMLEKHLYRALLQPTGKYSSVEHILPDGRYFEDFLSTKYFKNIHYVGFTLNIEHVLGLSLLSFVCLYFIQFVQEKLIGITSFNQIGKKNIGLLYF